MRHSNRPLLVLPLLAALAACSDPGAEPGNAPAADAESAATPAPAAESASVAPPPAPAAPDPGLRADSGAVVPVRFRGRYASDAAACDATGHESRLRIDADRIAFHESSGPVTAVSESADEITIKAKVTGEGETREASWTFRLDADGHTLTDVAAGMARQRCG